jgi:hypothetical protein
MLQHLVGKELELYPNFNKTESVEWFGILESWSQFGILIRITRAGSRTNYKRGQEVFIAYSDKLNFAVVQHDS